jgi:DDE superfamily endonuclease
MAKSSLEGDGRPNARCSLSGVLKDEMGTNTSLSLVYEWSKKGERAHCLVPRNRGKNTTVLASMSVEGMGSSLAVEGATTARVFETYVERVLAPTLREGQVVVMDNLSAHKGEHKGADRGEGLRAYVPAVLLTGS